MEENQIEQSLRLQKLIKALNLNQSSFAESLGVTQPNISKIISGKNQVSVEVLNRIARVYRQVNLHWLLTGDGEMFFEKSSQADEGPPNIVEGKGTLAERLERLEEIARELVKDFGK